jgi:hypothetical protein
MQLNLALKRVYMEKTERKFLSDWSKTERYGVEKLKKILYNRDWLEKTN